MLARGLNCYFRKVSILLNFQSLKERKFLVHGKERRNKKNGFLGGFHEWDFFIFKL